MNAQIDIFQLFWCNAMQVQDASGWLYLVSERHIGAFFKIQPPRFHKEKFTRSVWNFKWLDGRISYEEYFRLSPIFKHLKGQLGLPVIEVAIRNSLKRKLPTPAFQLAESNLRRHSQLALFRLSWHDAYFAARQILWLVTPLLNFLLSNRLAPYKAEGGGFDQRKRREKS